MGIIKHCKNCLINEKFPNVKLDKNNICNLCLGERKTKRKNNNLDKNKIKNEFEKYIKNIKGKNKHDCVLLFSGGKDSIYMLYLLVEKYNLNVLTVNVDNGLYPKITHDNIKKTVKKFGTDHLTVKPEDDLFKRIYQECILNPTEKSYTKNVCSICHILIRSTGLNIAAEKNISLVISGHSQDQLKLPEIEKEKISNSWIPETLYHKKFNDKDRAYFWNPGRYESIPRFIHPLCFLDPPRPKDIIKILDEKDIIKEQNLSSLNTNCHMMWLTTFLDMYIHGYSYYVKHLCNLIRQGKESRLKWSILLPVATSLLKHKLVKRKQIKKALEYIDISLEDLKN